MIVEVNKRTESLINELLEVWEDSVKATHTFLSSKEIENIKEYVPQALKSVAYLIIIENENHKPIAFMGIENYNVNELAVNEQNPAAKGFYEHMGFRVYQRNELDDQGNPYPVLYMKLEK